MPISVTAARIGGTLLFDPTLEEESAMEARITMTFGSEGDLHAMQKGGQGALTIEEIKSFALAAKDKAGQVRDRLKGLIE